MAIVLSIAYKSPKGNLIFEPFTYYSYDASPSAFTYYLSYLIYLIFIFSTIAGSCCLPAFRYFNSLFYSYYQRSSLFTFGGFFKGLKHHFSIANRTRNSKNCGLQSNFTEDYFFNFSSPSSGARHAYSFNIIFA